jgi:glycosyltransferase involved in cell wall biosynthesis
MVKNKISIIVPCFQERNYIKGMVDSVEQQKLGHLQIELIIIDGGSNDGTLEMLSKLKKKYSFLTVLQSFLYPNSQDFW